MTPSTATFQEAHLSATPIRALHLQIEGTALEPVVAEFVEELDRAGIRLQPRFYLSTEWGVPIGSIAIAIPFYLAHAELTRLHTERIGHVEGVGRLDLLRYLRHEMGHVINYAYQLYDREDWVQLFGSITQPYIEEYRPQPFSTRFVRHLPGWYAQKHPDEDWAETFAVWMTPGSDWRADYADWPAALAKLEYCDRTIKELADRDPVVTEVDLDENVADLEYTLEHYYQQQAGAAEQFPPGLDGALRAVFADFAEVPEEAGEAARRPASDLLRRWEPELLANVYRWTGHFPERTRALVRHLANRADQLGQFYPKNREAPALLAVTTLITALAMNHVLRGSYLP
jgi:hypothetical protein